jgi:hypothetical protein
MDMKAMASTMYALVMLWAGCDGSSGGMAAEASVAGALTLPGTATARYFVRLQSMIGATTPVAERECGQPFRVSQRNLPAAHVWIR